MIAEQQAAAAAAAAFSLAAEPTLKEPRIKPKRREGEEEKRSKGKGWENLCVKSCKN